MSSKFNAEEHGFRFVNYFDFSENLELSIAPFLSIFGVDNIDLGRIIYGLCGGMCFAALDYFYAPESIPNYTDRPSPNKHPQLYSYLVQRQNDSLSLNTISLNTIRKLFRWLFRKNAEIQKLTLENEFPKMRRLLRQNQPVVLVLMRGDDLTDATKNHQVVATSYTQNIIKKQATISLYDPNHPGKQPTIFMEYGSGSVQNLQQSTGEELYGFFVNDYTRKTPSIQE